MPKITESQVQAPVTDPGDPYPDFEITKAFSEDAITGPTAMEVLGWEDEDAYALRVAKENNIEVKDGKPPKIDMKRWLINDIRGKKVMLWNNEHNRQLDRSVTDGYRQDILMFKWAGPTTIPGGTVNGETISISRKGQVVSGQKRLVAVVDAYMDWLDNYEKWSAFWPKEKFPSGPLLESVMVYGVSDDQRVIQTVDNVQMRSEADTFQTTNAAERIFGAAAAAKMPNIDISIACKGLQAAVDFLWDRVRMDTVLFKTRSMAQQFLEDHPRLYKCVKHIYEENAKDAGRPISLLRLSPGQCAAQMYLMATGKTKHGQRHEVEKGLDMSQWAKAEEFWAEVARKQGGFKQLADQLGALLDSDEGSLGVRRTCTLAKAWSIFIAGGKITRDQLKLETTQDDDGRTHFIDPPDFGGIDQGPKLPKAPDGEEVPAAETVEQEKARIKEENAKMLKQKNETAKNGAAKPKALTSTPTTAKPSQKPAAAPAIKIKVNKQPAKPATKK